MAKVTAALCTFNRSKLLSQALNGVIGQSYEDIEIIVLDNASTDDTNSTVSDFADPRIAYHRNDRNLGAIANGNKAIELASGQYLIIAHDDDILEPGMIQACVSELDAHPELVAVAANMLLMDSSGKTGKPYLRMRDPLVIERGRYYSSILRLENPIPTPAVLIRRSVLVANGIRLEEAYGPISDVMFWLRLNRIGPIKVLSKPLARYRVHANQDSKANAVDMKLRLMSTLKACPEYRTTRTKDREAGERAVASAIARKLAAGLVFEEIDHIRLEEKIAECQLAGIRPFPGPLDVRFLLAIRKVSRRLASRLLSFVQAVRLGIS